MTAISIQIEGQNGLTWPRWRRVTEAAEALGFAGVFRSDHFTNMTPPDLDSLELIVSETYLADHSQRVHFGPLVASLSFRDPRMLARQAVGIDDLSGGRFILGLGAGWQEREHTLFGYDLGDVKTRLDRFEEGVHVISWLLKSNEPVTFAGRHFQLNEATLLPRPTRRGGPPILIGGSGPKRTLPLVARYADIWNGVYLLPQQFAETSKQLDELVLAAGRQPADVKRTTMMPPPDLSDPDGLRRQLDEYAAVGVDELMFQWLALDDLDGLERFAEIAINR